MGNLRSEHNWTVVWAIASLLKLTEEITSRLSVPQTPGEERQKRQRFTSAMDDVFRDSFASSGAKRICALQLIPFIVRGQIDFDSKITLLQRLIPNINDDNASVGSWTMVAIARFVSSRGMSALTDEYKVLLEALMLKVLQCKHVGKGPGMLRLAFPLPTSPLELPVF